MWNLRSWYPNKLRVWNLPQDKQLFKLRAAIENKEAQGRTDVIVKAFLESLKSGENKSFRSERKRIEKQILSRLLQSDIPGLAARLAKPEISPYAFIKAIYHRRA